MTKRKKTLLGVAAILGIAVIAIVVTASRPRDLVLIGVIDANDVVVTPRVQARLDSLFVDEGSEVKAGQLIATLESSELAAQAASVAAAASSAAAQLSESRSSALQVSGSTEAAVAGARARLASARASLTREQAQLSQDSSDAVRTISLGRSGGVSPADVEKANNTLHAQQAVAAARAQEVTAAEADLANAQSGSHAVAAANSQIATTEARVRGARADSLAAMTRLQYAELRAPVSGTVQVLSARRGELVGPGTPVAVIVDPMSLWVRVAIPETDAGGIAVGDSLTVRVATGDELRGKVISKGAEGDFATQRDVSSAKRDIRAVALRVAIPNPRRTLVPGMTAQVVVPPKK
ncbi:MAG TPA: efflux RND transporter periplasmic adaptor subunit [Gemmatimonadaceae bacterium]|jgi:multidrug resistance efflux pump